METIARPLGYLGGDIMTYGSNLAREEEYKKFQEAGIPGSVYSPVMNKSINDKSNMTEEENNCLAEKIVEADVDRLWNSDYTVLCPEQSAIGTMCEMSILYGWKYMAKKIMDMIKNTSEETKTELTASNFSAEEQADIIANHIFQNIYNLVSQQSEKKNYAHYFDIRTNHLNEKDWRRSFSINQLLYGLILDATTDHTLHNSFDEIIPILKEQYCHEQER